MGDDAFMHTDADASLSTVQWICKKIVLHQDAILLGFCSALLSFMAGNRLMLIGAHGVGKNNIADCMLQLLQRKHEYLQLHRDVTVSAPTLRGVLVWETCAWMGLT